jgi:hypothetical protein
MSVNGSPVLMSKMEKVARACAVLLALSASFPARAAPEDIMVGAFDKITGVPIMGALLAVVRSGERNDQQPEALDRRLRAIEALVQAIDARVRLVEGRLVELQVEVVKIANINRLRELQRIRAELAEIIAELLTRPADPAARAILIFRAQQQADLLKDNVGFDIWMWSDLDPASPTPQLPAVRTRFLVLPTFELYALAINTWFAAIEQGMGAQPQQVVLKHGSALRNHAGFLRLRNGWQARRTDVPSAPVTLLERLHTAAFCRFEAIETFANHQGECPVAIACIDEMEDTWTETGRTVLTMQPATVGTLCTWDPDRELDLEGEEKLRADHGALVMAALADALDKMAATGTLREQFVGEFANVTNAAVFSVPLDRPVRAERAAAVGSSPFIPGCPGISGCVIGPQSAELHWRFSGIPRTIRHHGSGLCLDVKNNAPAPGADLVLWTCNGTPTQQWTQRAINNVRYNLVSVVGGLCATVSPRPASGNVHIELEPVRRMSLQPCDNGELQTFSATDSRVVGPN